MSNKNNGTTISNIIQFFSNFAEREFCRALLLLPNRMGERLLIKVIKYRLCAGHLPFAICHLPFVVRAIRITAIERD